MSSTLDSLTFSNRYGQLPEHFYQRKSPQPLKKPATLVALNPDVASLLGINPYELDQEQLTNWMTGHLQLKGSEPLAMKYAGHQFGHYNPDLGDGRGLLLGEITNPQGQHWEVHLKGGGQTAFSRFGDGRAVLRSSIREFLGSEALHYLGIPTTRALAVTVTGEAIRREQLEPGATLLRVTPSHLRFGHFEHFYYRQDQEGLKILLDFSLANLYPHLLDHPDPALALFDEVQERTAYLVALWQAYGFCHGVLNTDNMSLLGETLDYGPFAFLDFYQPGYVGNHSDDQGRYAFDRQPEIVHWNLTCLAQALSGLTSADGLKASLNRFPEIFQKHYRQSLAKRLGVSPVADWPLLQGFLGLCENSRVDWTRFLRLLAEGRLQAAETLLKAGGPGVTAQQVEAWMASWQKKVDTYFANPQERCRELEAVNPCVLPRTHRLQQAITAAEEGDFSEVNRMLAVFRQPFTQDGKQPQDQESPPAHQQCLPLSCSS
jgi:uncharacterized protein YdiU (UPF0061 family)